MRLRSVHAQRQCEYFSLRPRTLKGMGMEVFSLNDQEMGIPSPPCKAKKKEKEKVRLSPVLKSEEGGNL